MEICGANVLATTQAGLTPFAVYRPRSLEELRAALREAPTPVVFYAGGTDVFAQIRKGLQPASLIWLDRMDDLHTLGMTGDRLEIGAGLSHDHVVASPALEAVPGLADAWARIATVRIRRYGTLGGNLMARHTRYELSILLSALAAEAVMFLDGALTRRPVEALWSLPDNGPTLLMSVSIPLTGAPRLDYARDLRPISTQALAQRDTGRRFVLATEYLRPWVAALEPGESPDRILARLPDGFSDPVAARSWLQRAATALLERQIARLEAA